MAGAPARAWWTDVEDVRARIERRRELEQTRGRARRTVSVSGRPQATPVRLVSRRSERAAVESRPRQLPRRLRRATTLERIGPRPDRIAAWAFVLGLLLVLAAVLSTHA
jgi:hypothetical protein